jgi:molecular chaperone DnaJ
MRAPGFDYYAVLGLTSGASAGELRRAYRILALRFHPDRAGVASTPAFQRISEAYRTLADPSARAIYDRWRVEVEGRRPRPHAAVPVDREEGDSARDPGAPLGDEGDYFGPGGYARWRAFSEAAGRPLDAIARLSGPVEILIARGSARREGADITLVVTAAEATQGGTAAIEAPVPITCPTCSGVAAANAVWCVRCEYAGTVVDEVAILVRIPPHVADRSTFSFPTDPAGILAPLRVTIRIT